MSGLSVTEVASVHPHPTRTGSTTGRDGQWRAVIAAVRAEFDGTLTYAGDWTDAIYVPWWDALDLIGVDAYYQLAEDGNGNPLLPAGS